MDCIIKHGTTIIKKGMVDPNVDHLYIPATVRLIKEGAVNFAEVSPDKVIYEGTTKQFAKMVIEEDNWGITNANCKDGNYIRFL